MDSHKLDEAATHAIHALPADEAESFERNLNSELRRELDSFGRVAAALTDGLPEIAPAPAPDLWDRISAETGITSPPPPVQSARRFPLLILAAAAIVAVVAVGTTSLLAIRDTTTDPRSLAVAATNSPDSLVMTLQSPDGITGIEPEIVMQPDGTGYVVADSLPRLNEDRTYQLWVIVDDRVVSAALLGNAPEVVQFRAEGEIAGIAISNEVAGGVVVSDVPPTAIWLQDSL